MAQLIHCDNCGVTFSPEGVRLVEERLVANRTGTYFACPVCGHKYPVGSVTDKGAELRTKLQETRSRFGKARPGAGKVALQKQFDRLLVEYQREVTGPYTESEVLQ